MSLSANRRLILRHLAIISAAFVVALLLCGRSPAATPGVSPFWAAVAQCETGSTWNWGAPGAPNAGGTYQGGPGFYYGTWTTWAKALGLAARYPHAYNAPPAVQARVAHYGYTVKDGYWGCIAQHAYIRALPGA